MYGPGDRATLLLFQLMRRGWLPIPPDPAARVSLIYVEDLCRAIDVLVTGRIGRGTVLEVRDGNAEGYHWRQIAAVAGRHLGRHVRCLPVSERLLLLVGHMSVVTSQLTGAVPRISPGKARELCHIDWVCRENPIASQSEWEPRVGIEEGFRRTLGWYRERNWL